MVETNKSYDQYYSIFIVFHVHSLLNTELHQNIYIGKYVNPKQSWILMYAVVQL